MAEEERAWMRGQESRLIYNQLSQMYFGINPFGLHFGMNGQQQQAPQPANQNGQNGGFFAGFNNFIQNNFMNPLFPHARPQQQPPRPEQPRPTFSRRSSKPPAEEKAEKKEEVKEGTGLFWKLKGNEAYQKGDLQQAMACYSRAIDINPTESVFYSNRAQCLKRLGRAEAALKDAQEAVELDSTNIRGHLLCGQALAELGKQEDSVRKVENAITRLTKALTLNGGKKMELEKEISRYIYLAKKLLFYLKFKEVRNSRITAAEEYKAYLDADASLPLEAKQAKLQAFLEAADEQLVFSIPDYLTCRITLELMEDPVTTDCGQTYEREALEHHLEKNGRTDPFTRQPIKGALYPNVAIRKAVQDFLQRNPWAYEYCENENYKDIAF